MFMKIEKLVVALLAGAAIGSATDMRADVKTEFAKAQKALTGVIPIELPEKAARFVVGEETKNHHDAAVGALKAAISLNRTSVNWVLASVVHTEPSAAVDLTLAAVAEFPNSLQTLAQIAAKNAPDQAVEIVAALGKKYPNLAKVVAVAVGQVLPDKQDQILTAFNSLAVASGKTVFASREERTTFFLDNITANTVTVSAGAFLFAYDSPTGGNAANNGATAPVVGTRSQF